MININESDILCITIADDEIEGTGVYPTTVLQKKETDGKKYYLISYDLSRPIDGFTRCECCGEMYDSNLEHCPECDNNKVMIAEIPDIPEIIYQSLEDGKHVLVGLYSTNETIDLKL